MPGPAPNSSLQHDGRGDDDVNGGKRSPGAGKGEALFVTSHQHRVGLSALHPLRCYLADFNM